MKTIQEVIREMDPAEIEEAYFTAYPDALNDLDSDFDDLTIKETKDLLSRQFQDFLRSLKEIDARPNEIHRGILFLSKVLDSYGIPENDLEMVHSDELLNAKSINQKTVPSCAFELTPREEALSFLVADNKLTQDWLMTVVEKFLYEMAFFGYEEEGAIDEAEELERRVQDIKDNSGRFVSVDLDELWEQSGLPRREDYPREKEIRDEVINGIMDYVDYCRTVELERIKESLQSE